jgi:lipoic acid synthetase
MNKLYALPSWFKQEIPDRIVLEKIEEFFNLGVHTVCQEAKCPNISSCFKNNKATFMILGDTCTRSCRFCGVKKVGRIGKLEVDLAEPFRIREAVKKLGINYVVITSVTRDDLKDGGAAQFAKVIELIRDIGSDIKVEALIPDFRRETSSLEYVLGAFPTVVAHNIETVSRLYGDLRPQANYQLSLKVLSKIKELMPPIITKSSLMLGLGETRPEVIATMKDLRYNSCDILTLGQYLAPSVNHYPVKEFINIGQFQEYEKIGIALGFKTVLSGPLVRSSYHAEEVYTELLYV